MCCALGCRCGLDPTLLWLWRRLAAVAPIRPLAWELPCAMGVALKIKTKKKKKGSGKEQEDPSQSKAPQPPSGPHISSPQFSGQSTDVAGPKVKEAQFNLKPPPTQVAKPVESSPAHLPAFSPMALTLSPSVLSLKIPGRAVVAVFPTCRGLPSVAGSPLLARPCSSFQ